MIWYVSDLHIGHKKVIEYCDRPYNSVGEMDEAIIKQWNSQVNPGDIVYFLGDFGINKNKILDSNIVNKLNGKKHAIIGNHDYGFIRLHEGKNTESIINKYLKAGWESVQVKLERNLENGMTFIMSHLPPSNEFDGRYSKYKIKNDLNVFHINGHLHAHYYKKDNMIDVAFDAELRLRSEDEIIETIHDERDFIPTRLTEKYKENDLFLEPFKKEVKNGYIREVKNGDLILFNYNDKCVYDKAWNETTLHSRGLIYDTKKRELVALPFKKFFNLSELDAEKQKDIVSGIPPYNKYKVQRKHDGCFTYNTKLNLWNGGTMKIGDIVSKKLSPTLIGMNKDGELVPTKVINWHRNGTKNNWIEIEIDCPVSKLSGGRGINKLRVTDNHSLYLNGKWQPALHAKAGDILMNYENSPCDVTIKYINDMLLGDGCISKTHNASKFRTTSKIDHEEYINFRKALLGETYQGTKKRISGYGSRMIDLDSKTLKSLNKLRKKWYPKNKKIVPKDLSWFDDLTVAIWYMDDGTRAHSDYQKDRAIFSTNGFTKNDVKRLAHKLKIMYGVSCTVFNSKGWCIRVNAGKNNSIDCFWRSIRRYIPNCMQYKLPKKHRGFFNYDIISGKLIKQKKEVKILSVKRLSNNKQTFPHGRIGFDISTETTNYFAKGVLVHNSLGIIFNHNGKWRVATRGSFTSEQAIKAQEMLDTKYNMTDIDKNLTILTEIIYPENRIVTDYGNQEKLILLAIFNRKSEEELGNFELQLNARYMGMELTQEYEYTIKEMIKLQKTLPKDEEGFVVRFDNGERIKIKGEEYLRHHRLVSQITPLTFWENMENGIVNRELLEQLPEEREKEIQEIKNKLEYKYMTLKNDIEKEYEEIIQTVNYKPEYKDFELKKGIGLYTKDNKCKHKSAFFLILNENDSGLDGYIMRNIRPTNNII